MVSITNSVDMNLSKLRETVKDKEAWCAAVHGVTRAGHDLATEQQQEGQNKGWCFTLGLPRLALVRKNLTANVGDSRRNRFNLWFGKIPWRKIWQPTPLFLSGESHGERSLAGPWEHTESDMTEETWHTRMFYSQGSIKPCECSSKVKTRSGLL